MSGQDENSNLYTTRATGELPRRLDEYINKSEESKSAALRTLLDRGLDAEAADVDPGELQQKVDEAREARERVQSELDDTEKLLTRFRAISDLTTAGILSIGFLSGLSEASWAPLGFIPAYVFQSLIISAVFMVFAGLTYRIYVLAEPQVLIFKEWISQLTNRS